MASPDDDGIAIADNLQSIILPFHGPINELTQREDELASKKVAVVMPEAANRERLVHYTQAAELEEDVEFIFVDAAEEPDEVLRQCSEAAALMPSTRTMTTDQFRRLPNLRHIQVISAGTDWLDKVALAELGVTVSNNGGGNAPAVAEHAIALMISVYRRLDRQFEGVKARRWSEGARGDPNDHHTLVGKRVGIVGLGRIGSRVAKRLAGWECEIVYHDSFHFPAEYEEGAGATLVSFEELLKTSDIVSLHTPLETTTRYLISDREFGMMKPTAILINTCRGPVVDEAALTRALRAGVIKAAGLDVTEVEPTPPDNPLLDLDNVVITPHLASMAIESTIDSVKFGVQNAARAARGETPESVVPPV